MKLRISWNNNDDKCVSFYLGERKTSFALLMSEIAHFQKVRGYCAFMDLSRVVVLTPDAIRVVHLGEWYDLGTTIPAGEERRMEMEGYGFKVRTLRLFEILQKRIELGAYKHLFRSPDYGEITVDLARVQWPMPERRMMGVMEVVNSGQEPYLREQLARSLAAFSRTLSREYWQKLMEQCSRVLQDGGRLFGGGEEEINFRVCGMYGGIIRRGAEYSTHT